MTLIDTYYSRKELIASNLTQQGVEATADEGLTTLANKILLINNCDKKSKSKLIIRHFIDAPEELQDQITIRGLTTTVIGPTINLRVSYSVFDDNMYVLENIPNGRYSIYCNAIELDNNPSLKSNSMLFNYGVLTDNNNLVLTTYARY